MNKKTSDALAAATITLTKRVYELERELEDAYDEADEWRRHSRKWEARAKSNRDRY